MCQIQEVIHHRQQKQDRLKRHIPNVLLSFELWILVVTLGWEDVVSLERQREHPCVGQIRRWGFELLGYRCIHRLSLSEFLQGKMITQSEMYTACREVMYSVHPCMAWTSIGWWSKRNYRRVSGDHPLVLRRHPPLRPNDSAENCGVSGC